MIGKNQTKPEHFDSKELGLAVAVNEQQQKNMFINITYEDAVRSFDNENFNVWKWTPSSEFEKPLQEVLDEYLSGNYVCKVNQQQQQQDSSIKVGSVVSLPHEKVSLATNPKFLGYGLVKEIKKNSFGRTLYVVNPISYDEKQHMFMQTYTTIFDEENPNPKKRKEILGYEQILNTFDESQVELAEQMLSKRLDTLEKFKKEAEVMLKAVKSI